MINLDMVMLSDSAFDTYCRELSFSESTIAEIQRIRKSDPSRRVASFKGNVCVRYPSRKMGVTIQAESHKVEFHAIVEMEYDELVLEYYDQPPQIKLEYEDRSGRKIAFLHTPDFFVLKKLGAGWIECKPEEKLREFELKNPNRYRRNESGAWRCPPGERVAQNYGFSYEVLSSTQINPVLVRNLKFLEDYARTDCPSVSPAIEQRVLSLIRNNPGISLGDLLQGCCTET